MSIPSVKIHTALDTLQDLVRHYPDGMLPPHACKQCGDEMGTVPAELYMGTYTGLCYPCSHGAAYCERAYSSGAESWNFPPHCPAWRRDREHFIGYSGCAICGGRGRVMISRYNSQGGSYPRNCEACATRHYVHPLTRREEADRIDAQIMRQFGHRKHGVRPAEVILYHLTRTGHMQHGKVNALIAKRLQARGVTL